MARRAIPLILVVDDVAGDRRLLEMPLVDAGYAVLHAEDGDTALRLIETELPDVTLLDVWLPGRTGFGVLEAVRDHPDPAVEASIIALVSGQGSFDERYHALIARADAMLVKPVPDARVLELCRRMTPRRRGD